MKCTLFKASNDDFQQEITINSIEDLKRISKRYRANLILDFNGAITDGLEITIYDDYIE